MPNLVNPLHRCEASPAIGGFSRLRLAYSYAVVQQQFQTESEIKPPLQWTEAENWIADWSQLDSLVSDLKINEDFNDAQALNNYSLKATLSIDIDPLSFSNWWQKKIKNRSFVIELTNNNGIVRLLNPFRVNYTYIGVSSSGAANKYELVFFRTRFQVQNSAIMQAASILLIVPSWN